MPAKKKSMKKTPPAAPVNEEAPTEISVVSPSVITESEVEGGKAEGPVSTIDKKKRPNRKRKAPRVAKTPSSYLLFSVEYRKQLITVEPTLGLGDVSKKCGQKWREMGDDEKDPYKKQADDLKAKAISEAPPPKPKKPPSSYLLFAMDKRKNIVTENPGLTLSEVSKLCGSAWKNLADDERKHWKDQADALRTPTVA